MPVRVISKALAAVEDLFLGNGTANQERASGTVVVTGISGESLPNGAAGGQTIAEAIAAAGSGGGVSNRCLVWHGSDSVGGYASKDLPFDNEVSDADNLHDLVSNTERITIPAALNGKLVRIVGYVQAGSHATHGDYTGVKIKKNGVAWTAGLPNHQGANGDISVSSAAILVATNDYFTLEVTNGSAGSLTVTSAWFSLEVVG